MKKSIFILSVAIIMLFSLTGCGNDIFKDQMNSEGHLEIYRYDGQNTTLRRVYETEEIQKILNTLSKSKANALADWKPVANTGVVYGITCYDAEGNGTAYTYIQEHLLKGDTEYEVKLDMEKIWNSLPTEWETSFEGFTLPGSYEVSRNSFGYEVSYLNPAPEYVSDEDVSMEIVSIDGTKLTVKLTNNREEEWAFGYYFNMDVLVDGTWYCAPLREDFCVYDLALIVEPGSSCEETYDISPYGDLPDGTYRLVVGLGDPNVGHLDEFRVEDGKIVMK